MSGELHYLPGYRAVSETEMAIRMRRQDELDRFHIDFEIDNEDLNDWQYFVKKEEFHHKLRQSITLVKK